MGSTPIVSTMVTEEECLKHFPKPDWAVGQYIRYDRGGLVEDTCKHGVGHPNRVWLKKYGKDGDGVHGCDGCCSPAMKKAIKDSK